MGLSENLLSIKSQTNVLIEYANGVTGASDTRLGDAVKTLADGFEQSVDHKLYPFVLENYEFVSGSYEFFNVADDVAAYIMRNIQLRDKCVVRVVFENSTNNNRAGKEIVFVRTTGQVNIF